MKGFERESQLLSLCGLNCGLCPLHLGGNCGGCGNGNQACKIARCSLEHGGVTYCYACACYPCEKYECIDAYDSFITHQRQKADLEKAREIGVEAYNLEQREKIGMLTWLLENYNDGRRKNFFCVAVNLLALSSLLEARRQIEACEKLPLLSKKEQAHYVTEVLQRLGDAENLELKLKKKK